MKNKFNDLVLDIYIDINGEAHLIECNPGSMWGSSGSSLFNWIVDFETLHNKNQITLRLYTDD